MKILAVDTAFGNTSVCVLGEGKVLSLLIENKRELQAERLFPMIEDALKESKATYNDIDIFSANLGPGSFTGIRIGLSGIRAVAYALNKKFVGINSLEALCWNYNKKNKGDDICALINANRNEAYLGYGDEKELINLNDIEIYRDKYKDAAFITDNENILERIKDLKPAYDKVINFTAQDIAEVAYDRILSNTADYDNKSPVYIRKPDAKLPTKKLSNI